jgi:hypothetical protein
MIYTAKRFAPKPAKVKPPAKIKMPAKIKKQKTAATLAATLAQAQAEAHVDELVNAFMEVEHIPATQL